MVDDSIDLRFLGHVVQKLREDIGNLQAEMQGFRAGDRETFQAIAKVEHEVHGLRRELQKVEAALGARFEQAHSTIASNTAFLIGLFNGLEKRIEKVETSQARLEASQARLEESQGRLEASQGKLDAGLGRVEAKLDALISSLGSR